jgi:hypothetical protein
MVDISSSRVSFFATAVLVVVSAVAQSSPYIPPKTPWGDPDLEGLWPGSMDIPLQRPEGFGERNVLTDEELEDRNRAGSRQVELHYWMEHYPATRQASLIVDPKDGRLPPMIPEAAERNRNLRGGLGPPTQAGVEKRADSWNDFDLWGRCITRGLIGSMLPGKPYNKGNQILQSPGYIVIRNEMIHEARVIPLDGRGHVGQGLRSYMGDGRGHWEGDTLVVETTNFRNDVGQNGINFALLTDQLRIVERFARVASDQLSYDATVEDRGTWTRPWTIHVLFTLDPNYTLYEYACHEGNYGLANILTGAREQEKKERATGAPWNKSLRKRP